VPREAPSSHLDSESGLPAVGSLWERDDEVYKVELVYEAQQDDGNGGYKPVTLVKHIMVEPMPWHGNLDKFLEHYTPYDPEAE
jgi:hypothetical protein